MTSSSARPLVLYVDDEQQALKYFGRHFGDDFEVLVADCAEEALDLLGRHADQIAVVVADQRMPAVTGAELLAICRRDHPDTVRILTTAYSDLDAAIAAVNEGAIYHYALKPWDIKQLRLTLQHAVEAYAMTMERRRLLEANVESLQRVIINDRLRSLTLLTKGLASRVRHPLMALKTFLDQAPIRTAPAFSRQNIEWQDLLQLAQDVCNDVVDRIDTAVRELSDTEVRFQAIDVDHLLRLVVRNHAGQVVCEGAAEVGEVRGDGRLLQRLFGVLLGRMRLIDAEAPITVACSPVERRDQPGVLIGLRMAGSTWTKAEYERCFGPFSSIRDSDRQADLLCAYFIVYHHGGEVNLRGNAPAGPGFDIFLPLDPEATLDRHDGDWGERLFSTYPGLIAGA